MPGKIIFVILCVTVILLTSCSKKEDNVTQKKTDNPNTQTQTKNQSPSTQSNSDYYSVSNVNNEVVENQSVDFSWEQDGKTIRLSEQKGNVVLLNFWATWCPPCRKELPDLSQISNELKDKNFKMIGISVDENTSALKTFLEKNKLSYTQLHHPNGLLEKYMESGNQPQNVIPQTYIIDKQGKIVEKIIGGKSKEDFIRIINKYL